MKRFIVTILAVFYLGVSSGVTVHFHSCMGRLVEWGLTKDDAKKCGNCGMKKDNSVDCCKDRHFELKTKDSGQATEIVYHFNTLGVPVSLTDYRELEGVLISSVDKSKLFSDFPPRTQATAAFILNCNFRI